MSDLYCITHYNECVHLIMHWTLILLLFLLYIIQKFVTLDTRKAEIRRINVEYYKKPPTFSSFFKMESRFLSAVKGSAGAENRVAEDPVRKFCLGRLRNVPVQMACVVFVALQAVLINHHLVVVSLVLGSKK